MKGSPVRVRASASRICRYFVLFEIAAYDAKTGTSNEPQTCRVESRLDPSWPLPLDLQLEVTARWKNELALRLIRVQHDVRPRLSIVAHCFSERRVIVGKCPDHQRGNQLTRRLHPDPPRHSTHEGCNEDNNGRRDADLQLDAVEIDEVVGEFYIRRPGGLCHPMRNLSFGTTSVPRWYHEGGLKAGDRRDRVTPLRRYVPPAGFEPSDLPSTNRALCAAVRRTPLSYEGAEKSRTLLGQWRSWD